MKVTCLLFLLLMVSCAALMQATSYAASWQHASDKNHARSRAGTKAANRPKQFATSRKLSHPRNAVSIRQPALAKFSAAVKVKTGSIQYETASRGLPARSTHVRPSDARPTAVSLNPSLNPILNNMRHRAANSSGLNGSANSRNGNTGAISGTAMHRRP
jgi:hypothetical protein